MKCNVDTSVYQLVLVQCSVKAVVFVHFYCSIQEYYNSVIIVTGKLDCLFYLVIILITAMTRFENILAYIIAAVREIMLHSKQLSQSLTITIVYSYIGVVVDH